MYRRRSGIVEVFLVHPGGPYWSKKNEGSWTIPTRNRWQSASFRKRMAQSLSTLHRTWIGEAESGKIVVAWAFEGNCEPTELVSNTCEIEWLPRSGKNMVISEVDRGDWFSLDRAREFLSMEQAPLLNRFSERERLRTRNGEPALLRRCGFRRDRLSRAVSDLRGKGHESLRLCVKSKRLK